MKERRSLTRWLLTILGSLIGLWLLAPALIVIPLAFSSASSFVFPPPSLATTNFENFFSDKGNSHLRMDGVTVSVTSGVYAD